MGIRFVYSRRHPALGLRGRGGAADVASLGRELTGKLLNKRVELRGLLAAALVSGAVGGRGSRGPPGRPHRRGLRRPAPDRGAWWSTMRSAASTGVKVEIAATRSRADPRADVAHDARRRQGHALHLPRPQPVQSFWMRNTLIPLDMVFIDRRLRVVGVVERAEPQTLTSRGVGEPSMYVLEVPGGWHRPQRGAGWIDHRAGGRAEGADRAALRTSRLSSPRRGRAACAEERRAGVVEVLLALRRVLADLVDGVVVQHQGPARHHEIWIVLEILELRVQPLVLPCAQAWLQ